MNGSPQKCECSRVATKRDGSGWTCLRCHELNRLAWHYHEEQSLAQTMTEYAISQRRKKGLRESLGLAKPTREQKA